MNNQENKLPAVQNARPYRMDWTDFVRTLTTWKKILKDHPQAAVVTTLERASNLVASFRSLNAMHLARALSPQAKTDGIEKAIEGLEFYEGIPAFQVNQQVAAILSRKRGGVKPNKRWLKFTVIYDEFGAIVLPKTRIEFDIELANKLLEEHNAALEKAKEQKEKIDGKEETKPEAKNEETPSRDSSGEDTPS